MRREEQLGRDALAQFLATRQPTKKQSWSDGDDPPNYLLALCDTQYAVEITRAVVPVEVAGHQLSVGAVTASLVDFTKSVKTEAEARGILQGGYLLSLTPLPDLSARREALLHQCLAYIEQTRREISAPERTLHRHRGERWSIEKVPTSKTLVEPIMSFPARWEGEMRDDLRTALTRLSQTKAHKLRNIPLPKVLLILDAYGLADDELWIEIASGVDFSWTSATLRVYNAIYSHLLHSSDPNFSDAVA